MTNITLRILLAFLLSLAGSGHARAQGTKGFADKLAQPDPTHHSSVIVSEYGDAGQIVRSLESSATPGRINGYRVRIFYDNSQEAREKAIQTRAKFVEIFPDIPAYMTYENPYFKVSVGNCFTNEEAITLWGRVKGIFDKAFVTVESIPISEFGE